MDNKEYNSWLKKIKEADKLSNSNAPTKVFTIQMMLSILMYMESKGTPLDRETIQREIDELKNYEN